MKVGRKHDLVKFKTSWTSLTQVPSLLCPLYLSTSSQSVHLSSDQTPNPDCVTSLQTWLFTTIPSQHAQVCFATSVQLSPNLLLVKLGLC